MRLVIFGANGQTGRLVTGRALDAGHTVVAVTRRPGDFPIAHPALTVAGVDVHDATAVGDVVVGADAVLSTLGVPFTHDAVDTYSAGTANIVAAMRAGGVRRLAVVGLTGAHPAPGRTGAPFALRLFEPVITKTFGKTVYDDIRRMETIVRDSGLDWTIVRPSGLFDLPYVTITLPEASIRSERSRHAAIWPTISSPWPAAWHATTPSPSPRPQTPRRCGR